MWNLFSKIPIQRGIKFKKSCVPNTWQEYNALQPSRIFVPLKILPIVASYFHQETFPGDFKWTHLGSSAWWPKRRPVSVGWEQVLDTTAQECTPLEYLLETTWICRVVMIPLVVGNTDNTNTEPFPQIVPNANHVYSWIVSMYRSDRRYPRVAIWKTLCLSDNVMGPFDIAYPLPELKFSSKDFWQTKLLHGGGITHQHSPFDVHEIQCEKIPAEHNACALATSMSSQDNLFYTCKLPECEGPRDSDLVRIMPLGTPVS